MFANNPCHAIAARDACNTLRGLAERFSVRQHCSGAFRGEAKVAVCRRPGERRVEVPAMYLERAPAVGVSDIVWDRGEPVQRPALPA